MIRPLGKNVSAVIDKNDGKTASGLFMTDTASAALAPKIARVIAVGDEITKVKVGERVIFKPYATYEVNLKPAHERKKDDDNYVMLEEEDILGVVEPDVLPAPKAKNEASKK